MLVSVQHCFVAASAWLCLFLNSLVLVLPPNDCFCKAWFWCYLWMLALNVWVCTVLFCLSLGLPVSVQCCSVVCFNEHFISNWFVVDPETLCLYNIVLLLSLNAYFYTASCLCLWIMFLYSNVLLLHLNLMSLSFKGALAWYGKLTWESAHAWI